MYEELASKFVDDGFSVLRYDFYGHGCSKFKYGGDIFVRYAPNTLA